MRLVSKGNCGGGTGQRKATLVAKEVPAHNAVWDFEGDEIDKIWNL